MEEGETEKQFLIFSGFFAGEIVFLLEIVVLALEIGLDALGRLVGDFDAGLENGDGELGSGVGSEPEPEIFVHFVGHHFLLDSLEDGQPGQTEMAILQAHPVSVPPARDDPLLGDFALALSQTHVVQPLQHFLLAGQTQQVLDGVCSGGQHENQRLGAIRVFERAFQVEHRTLREHWPQLSPDELLHALHQLGGPHHEIQQQNLKVAQRSQIHRHLHTQRVVTLEDLLPHSLFVLVYKIGQILEAS